MVGLGNPGPELAGTRHNLGADAVTRLADRHGDRLRREKGLHAVACWIEVDGRRILLAVPETYMNESGRAVAPLVRRAGIEADPDAEGAGHPGETEGRDGGRDRDGAEDRGVAQAGGVGSGEATVGLSSRLIVVHDELDLPSGRLRIKAGGGAAGNNGIKSIDRYLHTNDYLRVRIGIGKPPGRQPGAEYVLKRPGAAEREVLAGAVEEAADAVELIVTAGVAKAMTQVNRPG